MRAPLRPSTLRILLRQSRSLAAMAAAQAETGKKIFAPGSDPSQPGQAKQFDKGALERSDLSASPLDQFHAWFETATKHPVPQAEACTLSTAELPSGRVSARIVYLKELDPRGFVIYSNWATSRKAADFDTNPNASLVFWWRELERQVRIEGWAERLTDAESQVYYDTRIRGSRIGAWASEQSKVLQSREELGRRVDDVEKRFAGKDEIPVPSFWGGLRLVPETIEFWQGRDSRLHDRFRYTSNGTDGWIVERLSP